MSSPPVPPPAMPPTSSARTSSVRRGSAAAAVVPITAARPAADSSSSIVGTPPLARSLPRAVPILRPATSSSSALSSSPAGAVPASLPRSQISLTLESFMVPATGTSPRQRSVRSGSGTVGAVQPPRRSVDSAGSGSSSSSSSSSRSSTSTLTGKGSPSSAGAAGPPSSPSPTTPRPHPTTASPSPRTRLVSLTTGSPIRRARVLSSAHRASPSRASPGTTPRRLTATNATSAQAARDARRAADRILAAAVLDPSVGSAAWGLQGGFALRDLYAFRERHAVRRVATRRRARSVDSTTRVRVRKPVDVDALRAPVVPRRAEEEEEEDDENEVDENAPNPARPLDVIRARDLLVPGGFRRYFVLCHDVPHAVEALPSTPPPPPRRNLRVGFAPASIRISPPRYAHYRSISDENAAAAGDEEQALLAEPSGRPARTIPTRTFFDFLGMYGNFAGASLWDEEELQEWGIEPTAEVPEFVDEEVSLWSEDLAIDETTALLAGAGPMSLSLPGSRPTTPMLGATPLTPRSLAGSAGPAAMQTGTASARKVFLLLIKAFIGTGVLFLPSAFRDGGLTFSFLFLIFISYLSTLGMLLLVKVNTRIPGSFGDIASVLYGSTMRYLVLTSIGLAQAGFCAAYIIFIAQNAQSLIAQVSGGVYQVSMTTLIAVQTVLYIPLALVRRIKNFAILSLAGDVCIVFGLGAVCYVAIRKMIADGHVATDIVQFNPDSFALYIGTACYTFEGVGLILPVAQSMKRPEKFPMVLSLTMVITTCCYLFVATTCYLAWGGQVQTIVLLNMPANDFSSIVFALYIFAIFATWPLVLFPVARILEQGLLPHADGKRSAVHKWQKNVLRTALVLAVAFGAMVGADALNRLVALIGSFACIPLSFIYPGLFSLRVFPHAPWYTKARDTFMVAFGCVAMVYVTYQTLAI